MNPSAHMYVDPLDTRRTVLGLSGGAVGAPYLTLWPLATPTRLIQGRFGELQSK